MPYDPILSEKLLLMGTVDIINQKLRDWHDVPYLVHIDVLPMYNPVYGDSRICICGHEYARHFDTYENQAPVGCEYCTCSLFMEQGHEDDT